MEPVREIVARAVPLDRGAHLAGSHDGGPSRAGRDKQYHPLRVKGLARGEGSSDVGRAHVRPEDQADRRVRPLARRRAKIARPALVRMRIRNPCVFAR